MALDYAGGALTNAFSSGTSGITGGGFGSFSGGTFSAGSTASKIGMFANPVGLALAGGQLAMGVANMIQQDRAATQQAYNQAYSTTYNNAIGQFRAEQANQQTAKAFSAKLDYVKDQISNNYLGAQASWTAEQMRLNEVFDRAAYQSQALQKMLEESVGTAAAREVFGKSARRGAMVATLGAYGRSRAQQADQLMSEMTQAQITMRRTEQQMQAANRMAMAEVSVLPQAQTFAAQPLLGIGGGGMNAALQIGGLGMQAFQTGLSVTPKEMKFLGFQGLA